MNGPDSRPAYRGTPSDPEPSASNSAAFVRVCGRTDTGLVRRTNEDAFLLADLSTAARWRGGEAPWKTLPSGVLIAVSDGMGGANAGEVASALTVDGVFAGMMAAAHEGPLDGETLRGVVERASRKVHEAGRRPDRRGMGATLTAVLLRGSTGFVAQIGDSRAYLLRGGAIGQVTHDQSYVQMLVDAGIMTREQAERSSAKNIILQVMGQEEVRVAIGRVDLRRGDRLLLCSDGLTNVVDDDTLNDVARPPADLERACVDLIAKTKAGGAPDNVTVVLADIG